MHTLQEASSRDRILDAALELFSTQGYGGASMRQIAAAVGMRASSLYNHFEGKEAILSALIDVYGPAQGANRLASPRYRALVDDPEAFCQQYAADCVDQWCDPREQRFMALLSAETERLGAERAHFVETLFDREVLAMAGYLSRFALTGGLHIPDPKECARLFMGGLTFVRMQHLLMAPEPSPREVIAGAVDRVVANFLQLIAPRS